MIKELKKELLEDTKIVKKVVSDGCTGVPEFNLSPCCDKHDDDYKKDSGVGRFRSDWNLLKCGWNKANCYNEWYKRIGTRIIATGFYAGVSVFGWFFYNKE